MTEFLNWFISFFVQLIAAVGSWDLVNGISVLAFIAAFFVLGLVIQNLLFRG